MHHLEFCQTRNVFVGLVTCRISGQNKVLLMPSADPFGAPQLFSCAGPVSHYASDQDDEEHIKVGNLIVHHGRGEVFASTSLGRILSWAIRRHPTQGLKCPTRFQIKVPGKRSPLSMCVDQVCHRLFASTKKRIYIWNAITGERLVSLPMDAAANPALFLSICSASGTLFASSSSSETLQAWRLPRHPSESTSFARVVADDTHTIRAMATSSFAAKINTDEAGSVSCCLEMLYTVDQKGIFRAWTLDGNDRATLSTRCTLPLKHDNVRIVTTIDNSGRHRIFAVSPGRIILLELHHALSTRCLCRPYSIARPLDFHGRERKWRGACSSQVLASQVIRGMTASRIANDLSKYL